MADVVVTGDNGRFVLPEDAESIIIRPVYANSGSCADEDVTVQLR